MDVKTIIVLFFLSLSVLGKLSAIELPSIQQEDELFQGKAGTDCAYFAVTNAETLIEESGRSHEELARVLADKGRFLATYEELKRKVKDIS